MILELCLMLATSSRLLIDWPFPWNLLYAKNLRWTYNLQKLNHQKPDVKSFFRLINTHSWIDDSIEKICKNINKYKKCSR